MRRTILLMTVMTMAAWPQAKPGTAALEGYDPVLLSEGREEAGDAALSVRRGRFLYQFANAGTKARFEKEPGRYEIQLDGACARMGAPTSGNPDTYFVHAGRIYIFGSSECYKKFAAAPERFLGEDKGYTPGPRTAEARGQGERVWQRVRGAMTGARGAVKSVVELREVKVGPRESTVIQMMVPPATHRNITRNAQFEFGNVVTPEGAMQVVRGAGVRLPGSFEAATRAGYGHDLITLLLGGAVEVYAVDENTVEVKAEGVWSRVGVNAQTGLVEWLSYRGRGVEGGFEETRVRYSDYRETAGGKLPFRADVSVAGDAVPARGWTVVSYEFNAADIESRLEMPGKVRDF